MYHEKNIRIRHNYHYEDVNHQCRAVSFLAEHLICCYIVAEIKPFCITSL